MSTFFSPVLRERYGRPGTSRLRFLKDCIHTQILIDQWLAMARQEGFRPTTEAGYNHYLRSAMVRELTKDRSLPADFAADAYEWLSDCEVTKTTRDGEPDWYYAMLVDHWYEGGLSAFLSDKAAWDEHQYADYQDRYYPDARSSGCVADLPYSAQF